MWGPRLKTNSEKREALTVKKAEYLAEIMRVREQVRTGKVSASYGTNVELDYAKKIIAVDRKIKGLS